MAVVSKDYIGRVLGGYRLVALLGAGGAGAVFRGERLDDPTVRRAIKVLQPADDLSDTEISDFQKRFLRELQISTQLLHHAHILPILSYHTEAGGLSFMELPLMEGGTLVNRLAAGPIPLDDVASYLRQVASALDYAHHQGVVHRDVKAANVLLDRDGTAYLSDFGIARMFEHSIQPFDTSDSLTLTRTGQVIGTPSCMAPEQFTGGMITPQLDIYALGILGWQLVTGSLPFVASDSFQLALQHLNNPPPSACERRPELPEPADAALRKALAKRPEDRFDSAGTFATAFMDGLRGEWHPALSEPIAADYALDVTLSGLEDVLPNPSDPRTRQATRKLPETVAARRRAFWRAVLLAVLLLAVVAGGVYAVPRAISSGAFSGSFLAKNAPTEVPTVTPAIDPFKPLVPAGKLLYSASAPGQCDNGGARWFQSGAGAQQCPNGALTLSGVLGCDCPLTIAKLAQLPNMPLPHDYVIQVTMESIGSYRTDYFGFKFRDQASSSTPSSYGGYGILVDANGDWQFNEYTTTGKRDIKAGNDGVNGEELANPLTGSHTYDLIVHGSNYFLAIDGKVVITGQGSDYTGGIVGLAVEPRGVVSITNFAIYELPQ